MIGKLWVEKKSQNKMGNVNDANVKSQMSKMICNTWESVRKEEEMRGSCRWVACYLIIWIWVISSFFCNFQKFNYGIYPWDDFIWAYILRNLHNFKEV